MFWLFNSKKKKENDAALKKLSEREIQSQLYGHLKVVPEEKTDEVEMKVVPEETAEVKTRIKEISTIINYEQHKKIILWITIGIAGLIVFIFLFSTLMKFFSAPKPIAEKKAAEPLKQKADVSKPYTIQAATFTRRSDADIAVEKLSLKGYTAKISTTQSKKGGMFYRIYVGNYANKENASDTLERLKSEGFKDSFVRLER